MKKTILIALAVVAVLIVLPIAYASLRPNLIISKAEDKAAFTQPSSHFLHWRGAEIHYTDEGQGVPVLMMHGFGGSHINFNKLKDRMKDDYRVIRIYLPGFGLSDLPQPDGNKTDFVEQYRDFMKFFIDTLHLDSIYIVGNSMGGMVSWATAVADPAQVKKLVLISSAGYEMEKIANHVGGMMKIPLIGFMAKKGLPLSFSEGMARSIFADTSKIDHHTVKQNNMMWNRDGNLQAAAAIISSGKFPDSTLITQVSCPTLIIWGKEDKIVPVDHAYKFQRDIKGSQLIIYDPCGHAAMIERPDETADAIKRFFMGISPN